MKKYIYITYGVIFLGINNVFASKPKIISEVENNLPGANTTSSNITNKVGGELISSMIKYVAVIAVITLMISGIMYLLSNGEEEKVKKAKHWIIWSLVGVFLSISAMAIIKIINNIYI